MHHNKNKCIRALKTLAAGIGVAAVIGCFLKKRKKHIMAIEEEEIAQETAKDSIRNEEITSEQIPESIKTENTDTYEERVE